MTNPADEPLKSTPLDASHRALGARMVSFAGWTMPVEYSGVSDEHNAVRTRAGLFDVSHMGEIEIAGRDALAAVQRITSNDASKLAIGQAQYSALTTPRGTFVDDLLVYRFADSHFLFVVNAANTDKDFAWIREQIKPAGDAVAINSSARYALIALQGPVAREVLQPLTGVDLGALKYYWFSSGELVGTKVTISRTGYTGEDGFEVFVPPAAASRTWDALLSAGRAAGVIPAGLAARDTLRLEAAMRLYGNDMDETKRCSSLLVNAAHIKTVPGRKTDVKDCEWIADLLSHGLLKGSFIPPEPIRDLRDLTRYRKTLTDERVREVNRLQKFLEAANIKLSSVATDVMGVSGRAMLEALVSGSTNPQVLSELARGRLRKKLPEL